MAPITHEAVAIFSAENRNGSDEGSRSAHRRDGAAVARFLAWLDKEGPGGKLTEIDVVAALESFRRDTGALKEAFAQKERLVFLDFITDQSENVFPMIPGGKGLTEMILAEEL